MKSFTKFLLSSVVLLNATTLLAMDPVVPAAIGKGAETLGEELGVFGKIAISPKIPVIATAVASSPFGSSSSSAAVSSQRSAHEEAGESNADDCFGLTLEDFQGIIFEYPESQRLIIQEGTIVTCDADPKAPSKNRSENMQIMQTLMELIPKEIAEKVLAQNGLEFMRLPLSSEKLKGILQKVNEDVGILDDLETQSTATGYTQYTQSYLGKEIMGNIEEKYVAKTLLKILQENQNTKDIFGKVHESGQQTHPGSSSPQSTAAQKTTDFETNFSKIIERAKDQAEKAEQAAEIAQEKAERQGTSEKAWNKVLEEAEMAEGAYTHLSGLYKKYQKQAAEHYEGGILETQCSQYDFELKKAERKKAYWTDEVQECKQEKEALKRREAEKTLEQARAAEAKTAQEGEAARVAEREKIEIEKQVTAEKALKEKQELEKKANEVAEKKLAQEREAARIAEQARIEKEKKAEADRLEIARAEEIRKENERKKLEYAKTLEMAQRLQSEARNAGGVALNVAARAKEAFLDDQVQLWEEAIVRIKETEQACTRAIIFHRNEEAQAEVSQKGWWCEQLNAIEGWKTKCVAKITEWEIQKNQALKAHQEANSFDPFASFASVAPVAVQAEPQQMIAANRQADRIAQEIAKLQAEAKENAAEATRKSLEARSTAKTTTGTIANSWHGVANSLEKTSEYWTKAHSAQEAGKTTLAAAYREAAATSERAADKQKLSAQTYAAGKENEGNDWGWEGKSLQSKADYQAKAAEAQETGKTTLAVGYREAVTTSQLAADQYKLSAQIHAAGKESEGNSCHWEGCSLQAKADYAAKVIEAQEAGKTTLATAYHEAVATSQKAADQWKQSALAYATGGESSEYTRLWQAGQATQPEADAIAKRAEG